MKLKVSQKMTGTGDYSVEITADNERENVSPALLSYPGWQRLESVVTLARPSRQEAEEARDDIIDRAKALYGEIIRKQRSDFVKEYEIILEVI